MTKKRSIAKKEGNPKSSNLKELSFTRDYWTQKRTMCAVLILVLLFGVWWFLLGGSTIGTRMGMQAYLSDKYDKSFDVDPPRLTDYGYGVGGTWRAIARPAEDKEMAFEVVQHDNGQYGDRYPGAVWSKAETKVVESFLKTVFAIVPEFEVDTHTTTVGPDPIRGAVPSFSEAVGLYGEEMTYSIIIKIRSSALSEPDKQYHREQVEKLAAYVQRSGVTNPSVRYLISLDGEDAGYICHLSGETLNDSTQLSKCFDKKSRGKVW